MQKSQKTLKIYFKNIWIEHIKEFSSEQEDQEADESVQEDINNIEDDLEKSTKEEFEEIINSSRNGKVPITEAIKIQLIKNGGEDLFGKIYNIISTT